MRCPLMWWPPPKPIWRDGHHLDPWELRKAGIALLSYLDPDGSLTDDRDRAGHRRLSLAPQDRQLMSKLTGQLTPALRAKFELVLANYAAPGMNNPPTVSRNASAGRSPTSTPTTKRPPNG